MRTRLQLANCVAEEAESSACYDSAFGKLYKHAELPIKSVVINMPANKMCEDKYAASKLCGRGGTWLQQIRRLTTQRQPAPSLLLRQQGQRSCPAASTILEQTASTRCSFHMHEGTKAEDSQQVNM